MDSAQILVVAATDHEMAQPNGWLTLTCGVGPVEAAAATAAAIARWRPAAVLHVGIAGSRRHRGFAAGSLVIGSSSRYCDLHVPAGWAPHIVDAATQLVAAASAALPNALVLPIGTSAHVGGTSHCDVEAMEGFGVLRAAQLAGVPALEVRAISNEIEEADRSRWHFALAFAAIISATPHLVPALQRALSITLSGSSPLVISQEVADA